MATEQAEQSKGLFPRLFHDSKTVVKEPVWYDIGTYSVRETGVRYHFHIRDADGLIADEEGSELPSMEAAREEARASARDLAIEDLKRGVPVNGRQIEIVNPDGTVLQRILVQEILN